MIEEKFKSLLKLGFTPNAYFINWDKRGIGFMIGDYLYLFRVEIWNETLPQLVFELWKDELIENHWENSSSEKLFHYLNNYEKLAKENGVKNETI